MAMGMVWMFCSCNSRKPVKTYQFTGLVSRSEQAGFLRKFDSMKAAALSFPLRDSIKRHQPIYFSDPKFPDTMELLVPSGMISKTTSVFRIKTASNRVIYNDEFYTKHFADGVFEPPQLPDSGDAHYLYQLVLDYLPTITQTTIKAFLISHIDSFFADVRPVADKRGLISLASNFPENIIDTALYNEAVTNPSMKILCVRCYGCIRDHKDYYQVNHICYSPYDSVARPFFEIKYTETED